MDERYNAYGLHDPKATYDVSKTEQERWAFMTQEVPYDTNCRKEQTMDGCTSAGPRAAHQSLLESHLRGGGVPGPTWGYGAFYNPLPSNIVFDEEFDQVKGAATSQIETQWWPDQPPAYVRDSWVMDRRPIDTDGDGYHVRDSNPFQQPMSEHDWIRQQDHLKAQQTTAWLARR